MADEPNTAGAAAPAAAAAAPAQSSPATTSGAPAAAPAAAATPPAAADAKPAASLIADAKDEPAKDGDKPADAPKVEFADFKVPDGIELDKDAVTEFKTLAGEMKLDQAGAQKLVDFYTKAAMTAANAPYKLWEETQAQWQKEVKADPEIGGTNYSTSLASIAKLIDRFGGKEASAVRAAFSFTGAGNNPEAIRFLARIGKHFAENPNVTGRPPTTQGASKADRFYANSPAKAAE